MRSTLAAAGFERPLRGKRQATMWTLATERAELSDAWIEGDPGARWRSASGHGPSTGAAGSGSSVLEVDPGCRLPRHTDSAEEVVVVISGRAEVALGDERATVEAGGAALVPRDVPHEVRNTGADVLRFLAIYAGTDVVTAYEQPVQPDGDRQRSPVS
jgi:quercetin dioxygenase-like cupin family protein